MNTNTQNLVSKSRKSKQLGQGMSEYIIIVALVAVGGIAVFTSFGGVIRAQVSAMAAELSGGDGTAQVAKAQTAATLSATQAAKVQNMGTYTKQNQ